MEAATTTHASRNRDSLIDRVTADTEPMILCNDKGNRVVLMSFGEFSSWQETLYLLSNPANAEHLRQSIREAEAGLVAERELIKA
uniref:Antitoxin n=1 Tax=Candidatus Kentrum sp. DK TaxID=2126562 RepID=A0A450S728_9GAMM|nr:MAG: antitoxin YefM [Candidatus Kentron sp. DK]